MVECVRQGDELHTDVAKLEAMIETFGAGDIVGVLSTTSAFAPRAPDSLQQVS